MNVMKSMWCEIASNHSLEVCYYAVQYYTVLYSALLHCYVLHCYVQFSFYTYCTALLLNCNVIELLRAILCNDTVTTKRWIQFRTRKLMMTKRDDLEVNTSECVDADAADRTHTEQHRRFK
jgi:hypothetical protein